MKLLSDSGKGLRPGCLEEGDEIMSFNKEQIDVLTII